MLGFISLAMGLIFGFLTSLMFKHWRFLTHNAICENFVMIAMSLISYFGTNIIVIAGIEMSGIIALLTCGIV
jgi:sodium/hydrogen exchanger-like protein 6/7